MTKQELIEGMKKSTKSEGFITATQVARFIGVSNVSQCKYKYLSDLNKLDDKYYYIPDVARALMNHIS